MVQSRTWANINKPGGCAIIVRVHTNKSSYDDDEASYIEGLDVKYVVGGSQEKNIDPAIVEPYRDLERGRRSRRGRDFLMQRAEEEAASNKKKEAAATAKTKPTAKRGRSATGPKAEATPPPMPAAAPGKENRRYNSNNNNEEPVSSATCSTPEPLPRHRVQKKPTRVTPTIPRMVVVPNPRKAAVDDVSPMWVMDAAGGGGGGSASLHRRPSLPGRRQSGDPKAASASKPPTVARGLNFGPTPKKEHPRPPPPPPRTSGDASRKHPPPAPVVDRRSSKPAFSSSRQRHPLPPKQPRDAPLLPPGIASERRPLPDDARGESKPAAAFASSRQRHPPPSEPGDPPQPQPSSIPSKQPRDETVPGGIPSKKPRRPDVGDPSRKKKRPPNTHTAGISAAAAASAKPRVHRSVPSVAATRTKKKNPLSTRFTTDPGPAKPRAGTAAVTVAATATTAQRRSLKEVYEREREMALKFMGEMTRGGPSSGGGRDRSASVAKKPSRYDEFLSHLSRVWIRADGEDEISEDRFKRIFREVSGGSFSESEVDLHLASLCEEGKEVMASDGMLYRIN